MLASVTHILPLTSIRRERLLPVSGKVFVRKGQKVNATDVIAEAEINPEHVLLDVGRGLGLSMEQADRYLQCKVGMEITAGDVLAGPVGFTKRVIRSPYDGRVMIAGDGQIMLRLHSRVTSLKAGIPGMVTDLIDDRGAIITTSGALIQGVWGNGGVDIGLLNVMIKSPDDVLTVDHLNPSLRGSILLAGSCLLEEPLKMATEYSLRGLILSSIDATLLPLAKKLKFPVVVVEGFGKLAMNTAAYKLLTTNDQRETTLNAEPLDRFVGRRPEIIIPLPTSGDLPLPPEVAEFKPGQQVRVVRAPNIGRIGKLIQIKPGTPVLVNGVQVEAGDVRLENGEMVVLPLANLEVLI